MLASVVAFALAVVAVSGDQPSTYSGAPEPPTTVSSYQSPKHAPTTYKEEPLPYQFQYGVADDYSGAQFSANEESADGETVIGSYTVNLPDGRVQTVTYRADHHNGFVADVKVCKVNASRCKIQSFFILLEKVTLQWQMSD